jgi:hypothetical protein
MDAAQRLFGDSIERLNSQGKFSQASDRLAGQSSLSQSSILRQ